MIHSSTLCLYVQLHNDLRFTYRYYLLTRWNRWLGGCMNAALLLKPYLRQQFPFMLPQWGDNQRHSGGKMSTTELNIDLRITASFFL